MLMRFDPWRELDRLTDELFNGNRIGRGMPMDAYRKGDEFVVHLDLPGIDPDAIDLTVDRNVLTVTAERHFEPEEGVDVLVSERSQGKFVRRIFLGDSLDVDNLQARYDNGVLTVVIPVAESARPRKIQVATGDGRKALEAETTAA